MACAMSVSDWPATRRCGERGTHSTRYDYEKRTDPFSVDAEITQGGFDTQDFTAGNQYDLVNIGGTIYVNNEFNYIAQGVYDSQSASIPYWKPWAWKLSHLYGSPSNGTLYWYRQGLQAKCPCR
jgi:hypothetical protein